MKGENIVATPDHMRITSGCNRLRNRNNRRPIYLVILEDFPTLGSEKDNTTNNNEVHELHLQVFLFADLGHARLEESLKMEKIIATPLIVLGVQAGIQAVASDLMSIVKDW